MIYKENNNWLRMHGCKPKRRTLQDRKKDRALWEYVRLVCKGCKKNGKVTGEIEF